MPRIPQESADIILDLAELLPEACPVCGAETAREACWYPSDALAARGKRRPYAPGCPAEERIEDGPGA